jgi:hypothetical protein
MRGHLIDGQIHELPGIGQEPVAFIARLLVFLTAC